MTPGEAYTAAALALSKGDAEAARSLLPQMLPTDAGIMRERIYEAEKAGANRDRSSHA